MAYGYVVASVAMDGTDKTYTVPVVAADSAGRSTGTHSVTFHADGLEINLIDPTDNSEIFPIPIGGSITFESTNLPGTVFTFNAASGTIRVLRMAGLGT